MLLYLLLHLVILSIIDANIKNILFLYMTIESSINNIIFTCDSSYDQGVIFVAPAAFSIVCHAYNSRSLNSYPFGYIARKAGSNSITEFSDSAQLVKKYFQSAFAIVLLFT